MDFRALISPLQFFNTEEYNLCKVRITPSPIINDKHSTDSMNMMGAVCVKHFSNLNSNFCKLVVKIQHSSFLVQAYLTDHLFSISVARLKSDPSYKLVTGYELLV